MITLYRRLISLAVGTLALGLALASSPTPAQAAGTVYVDDSTPPCHAGAYTTIQAAVSAAPRKIIVCAGLYSGPITINGANNLKLTARPGVTLIPNANPFAANMIEVLNSSNVTVQGFTIDGQGILGHGSSEVYEVAINYWFSSGKIVRNTIQNWHAAGYVASSSARIRGISAGDNQNRKVTIIRNTITGYQGFGIEVRELTKAVVTRNTLNASGAGPDLLGGIVVWSGYYGTVSGSITKNTVTRDMPPASGSASYGLYLANASSFKVSGNMLTSWFYGIRLGADCPADGQADNLKVTGNKVNETFWGIWLIASPGSGCGGVDAHANNARITGNRIANSASIPASVGIRIQAEGSNPPNGLIQNVKVTGNKITNHFLPVYSSATPGSSITGKIQPN